MSNFPTLKDIVDKIRIGLQNLNQNEVDEIQDWILQQIEMMLARVEGPAIALLSLGATRQHAMQPVVTSDTSSIKTYNEIHVQFGDTPARAVFESTNIRKILREIKGSLQTTDDGNLQIWAKQLHHVLMINNGVLRDGERR